VVVRRLACTVPASHRERRLDAFVLEWLGRDLAQSLSRSAVRKLIVAGAIRVDGRIARRAGIPLSPTQCLEALVDLARLGVAPGAQQMEVTAADVLYEDEDLLGVAKPPGLPTHATADVRRADLFTQVRRLLAQRSGADAALPYLGLHHRLDVDTSGVVLFTKSERANRDLARQFAGRGVEKVYHALVVKPPRGSRRARRGTGPALRQPPRVPCAWHVENRLAPTGAGRRACVKQVTQGGQEAATSFVLLDALPAAWLVEARPETGRKHQVRAHLAGGGTPILGDVRYGGPEQAGACHLPRAMLHARSLSLSHPVTGAPLVIEAPYPPDFDQALRCLRRA
jgi:23S rRNA-/tRNA-specific pseudouridylate synthase